jgi:hypothetical protein
MPIYHNPGLKKALKNELPSAFRRKKYFHVKKLDRLLATHIGEPYG